MNRRAEDSVLRLMRAIAARDEAAVRRLLRDAPELGREALAVGATRAKATEYFLGPIRHYVVKGDTALHVAAGAWDVALARRLVKLGAEVGAANRLGGQPLHYAANGWPEMTAAEGRAQEAVIAFLVRAGADVNAGDKRGVTALHRAARNRCAHAARALLAAGADARVASGSGSTALDLARVNSGKSGSGSAAAREARAAIVGALGGA